MDGKGVRIGTLPLLEGQFAEFLVRSLYQPFVIRQSRLTIERPVWGDRRFTISCCPTPQFPYRGEKVNKIGFARIFEICIQKQNASIDQHFAFCGQGVLAGETMLPQVVIAEPKHFADCLNCPVLRTREGSHELVVRYATLSEILNKSCSL
jgi:hypothetical protein